MKIVSMVCPNCGASLQVDADQKNLTCSCCGNGLSVDDEVKHVQYDNAEETGYQFEKGRQRAQAEATRVQQQTFNMNFGKPPKKRKTWLWVLGWIFIFPVPLTILMLRNQKLSKPVKIGIIIAAWIVYLIIGLPVEDPETTRILPMRILRLHLSSSLHITLLRMTALLVALRVR